MTHTSSFDGMAGAGFAFTNHNPDYTDRQEEMDEATTKALTYLEEKAPAIAQALRRSTAQEIRLLSDTLDRKGLSLADLYTDRKEEVLTELAEFQRVKNTQKETALRIARILNGESVEQRKAA